jgi:hypothetical protein
MPPIVNPLHADFFVADQLRSAERRRLLRAARSAPAERQPGPTSRAIRFATATLGRALVALGTRLESAGRPVAASDCPAGC